MRFTVISEWGWFGLMPRAFSTPLLPGASWLFVRVSWCRGHLRTALLHALGG